MSQETVISQKRKLDKNQIRERISGYILMAPAAILLFVFTVYPIGYLFYRSLHGGNLITANPKYTGFALLKDADSLQRWNVIMAGNLLLVLPMLLLYILASKKIRNAFVYSGIK